MMDKGTVAEEGTHEELMAKKGLYYTLYKQQDSQISVSRSSVISYQLSVISYQESGVSYQESGVSYQEIREIGRRGLF
jgi:hypothetical protein